MDVIGLDCARENLPASLLAFLPNTLFTSLRDLIDSHRFAPPGTPNQMRDHEMNMVFISLIFKRLFPGLTSPYFRPLCKG
jgi:hypothetical protein